ncbi:glycoside hydrolase family 43 protein [Paenibacillus sp. LHD-117]|uniref:glycoside hydrolase family 43 protein n=1 Tax=Paenibacillus sp. LHD-117 TaxID=3071412 RepID=UPI0027DEFD1D|nr:glycoside hydrolase family 43 protein [Paenibacillus sp. LHD-117]MDQ6417876.1 glycoside hydrolase family 43 protein [Paenibacillus sp. LHD-117]
MTYQNPIIRGFHPDPSVCRSGEDYYLVTSSFEYFPGVPLFHSKDLVNWTQIGHVLTRPEQLDLSRAPSSGGIFAPTIREHKGTFYMITTNISAGGNFIVHTNDPRGEWSNPLFVDHPGIDPDLFFDEEGTVYLTSAAHGTEGPGIYQSRIDIKSGVRLSEPKFLWTGTGGQYPEAPHIYRIGNWYYLMIAEGGTEYGHMETIARSERPDGPFEPCPHNPILTHRSLMKDIHATGHADLVQTPEGDWWAVFLAIRPHGYPKRHHLGRETFLAPVTWSWDDWPIIGDKGTVSETMPADGLVLRPETASELPIRDDFDATTLSPCWNFLRSPDEEKWSLTDRPGSLTLRGTAATLNETGAPAFVARRQQHFSCRVSTNLAFAPRKDGEEAGLTVYMSERFHYDLAVSRIAGERKLIFRRRIGSLWKVENEVPYPADSVVLTIKAEREGYSFGFSLEEKDEPFWFGQGESSLLATEVAGGFTGVMIAMYATGNGSHAETPAHFEWFDYEGME